jgi:hypothetical protein
MQTSCMGFPLASASKRTENLFMSTALPWNDWSHCMGNTYGTWLPGDPRGFRTRHRRQHVEGDYKHPPPKRKYEALHTRAKGIMSREPVYLTPPQQIFVCSELVQSLVRRDIEVIVVSLNAYHFHLLARFRDHRPRHHLGVAKKESSYHLKARDAGVAGPIWAVRSKCLPIRDRQHQLNVGGYIRSHRDLGAVIWFMGRLV